ncbi:MAG: hypothetical protein IJX67_08955 [Oscillospiraceae bacterium]|nr:hypothetical protein [Oscillospiraceae bacterium]
MKTSKTPRNSLRRDHTIRQLLSTVFAVALFLANMISPAYAVTKLEGSAFYKGLMELLQDVSLAVTFAGPSICIICAGVFFARKSMADEQDGKLWNKRIVNSLICAVAIGLVAGLVTLITSYFNPTTP